MSRHAVSAHLALSALLGLGLLPSPGALGQESMERLLDEWRSEDWATRERASEAIADRCREWGEEDLARLTEARRDGNAEVAHRAAKTLDRVLARRRLSPRLVELGIDSIRSRDRDSIASALDRAAVAWWLGRVRSEDLDGLVDLAVELRWPSGLDELGPGGTEEDHAAPPIEPSSVPPLPPSYAPIFARLLDSPEAAVRARSIEELERIPAGPWVDDLARRLPDLPPDVQLPLAYVLAFRAGATPGPLDRFLAAGGPEFRWIALERLARTGVAGHEDELVAALAGDDAGGRWVALHGLTGPGARGATSRVAALLDDLRPEVRSAAATALGALGARGEADRLRAHLVDLDAGVRDASARALLALGTEFSTAELARFAVEFAVPTAELALLELAAREGPEATEALGRGLGTGSAPNYPLRVELLAQRGGPDSARALAAAVPGSDPHLRRSLLHALGRIGRDAADAVATLLSREEAAIRGEAARLLGDWRRGEVRDLETLLADPVEVVREEAARAIGATIGRDRIRALLAAGDPAVARGARAARLERGDFDRLADAFAWEDPLLAGGALQRVLRTWPRSDELAGRAAEFRSLLDHVVPEVRRAAVEALGLHGARGDAEAVASALGDPDPDVRTEAAVALGRLRSPGSLAPLRRALEDATPLVRQNAIVSLAELGDVATLKARLDDPDLRLAFEAMRGLLHLDVVPDIDRLADRLDARMTGGVGFTRLVPDAAGDGDRRTALDLLERARCPRELDREALLVAAAERGDASLVPALLTLLEAGDSQLRAGAVGALAVLDALPVELVASMLEDPHRGVRASVVDALGTAGGAEAVPAVASRLRHVEPLVRLAAAEALWRLAGRDPGGEVEPLLDDLRPDVASEAIRLAGRCGLRRLKTPIGEALRRPGVSAAAVEALGRFGATEFGPALAVRLGYGSLPDPVEAIGRLGDPRWAARLERITALHRWYVPAALERLGRGPASRPDWRADPRGALEALSRLEPAAVVEELSRCLGPAGGGSLADALGSHFPAVRSKAVAVASRLAANHLEGEARARWGDRLEALASDPSASVAFEARLGRLRLGSLPREAESALIDEAEHAGSIAARRRQGEALLDALAQRHEPDAYRRYALEAELGRSIRGPDDATAWLEERGVQLADRGPLLVRDSWGEQGRMSPRRLLAEVVRPGRRGSWYVEGGRVRLGSVEEALERWRTRLETSPPGRR